MKKTILLLLGLGLLAVSSWAGEMAVKNGQEVTITGHLSCAYCKLASGLTHKCSPECCQACIKGGDSALLQKDEAIYLLLSKEKDKPLMTPERIALAGGQVTVKGMVVKTGGMQAIYVEKMDMAK
jgi:hypothetical protein